MLLILDIYLLCDVAIKSAARVPPKIMAEAVCGTSGSLGDSLSHLG